MKLLSTVYELKKKHIYQDNLTQVWIYKIYYFIMNVWLFIITCRVWCPSASNTDVTKKVLLTNPKYSFEWASQRTWKKKQIVNKLNKITKK